MKRILLLDADKRSTLSIARSLNQSGSYRIFSAGHSEHDICRYSRSVARHFRYTDPKKDLSGFATSLREIIRELEPDFVLPCSDLTSIAIYDQALICQYPGLFGLPDKGVYFQASDKRRCISVARGLGIPVPPEPSLGFLTTSSFPLVVKPRFSWHVRDNKLVRADRVVCSGPQELDRALAAVKVYDDAPLIQEFVPGSGHGQFFASREGEIIAAFAHERVREIPPSGGYSSLRKSVAMDPRLREYSEKLIRALNWTGISMVEYRGDLNGDVWLMEVNGRPWGSLDLAVCAGVDFPKILVGTFFEGTGASELRLKFPGSYRHGHYSKWLVGEIKYIGYVMRMNAPLKWRLATSAKVLAFRPGKDSLDTFRATDPMPLVVELLALFRRLAVKLLLRLRPTTSKEENSPLH